MFRKMFFVFSVFMVIGILITGCAQQTPSITTTNSQPRGLAIKGAVYGTTLNNTQGNPIAGAVVTLSGDSANQVSVTNAGGEYLFSNIPDGQYILIVTAEGYQRNTQSSVTIKPSSSVPADNTITVQDIALSSRPVILSYSPTPNSVIGQNPTFIIKFNEVMDQSTLYPSLTAHGLRFFSLSGNTVPLAIGWADAKTLLLTPEAALLSNESYILDIDPQTTLKDASGFSLDTNTAAEQALASSVDFRTDAGGAPGAPSNISVVMGSGTSAKIFTSEAATGIDYVDITGATGPHAIKLSWLPGSGTVTGYKVYVADGPSSNYSLIRSVTTNYADFSISNLINFLYGVSDTDALAIGNYPMINKTLYIKVIAFNGDGESPAAATSVKELIGPKLSTTAWDGNGGTSKNVLGNNVFLPAIGTDKTRAYIFFTEPVDPASVVAANFSITKGAPDPTRVISSVRLLTQSSNNVLLPFGTSPLDTTYAVVEIVADGDITSAAPGTYQIKANEGGVKDLAGNAVATGGSITGTLP
jgi:hypothetical protein